MKYPWLSQYRTTNKWAEHALAFAGSDFEGQMKSLDSFLENPKLSGLKYKYYATPGNAEYMKMYRQVPLKNIINYANSMSRPLWTDFTEVTEQEEFTYIAGRFYYELFIQEKIYVTYNVFQDANAIVINPDEEKNRELVEAIREANKVCGFDL